MELFETVIGLLLVAALLASLADRIGVPYPALLALAGTGMAFIPGVPVVTPDPALALALFVAPTLLDSAYDASPRDLRDNLLPVATLAVVCVGITIAVVAVVARWCVPSMPWAAAVALGAVVAPPDASAAAAVLRRLRPPHRIMVVLEGESLFNDASALLVYRLAVAAAVTGTFSPAEAVPMLLLTAGGGAVLGYAAARLWLTLSRRLFDDIAIVVLAQFLSTFGVWMAAEALHLSAIITVVVYGMTLARHAPRQLGARRRIASYAVWEVVVFVLNALAFLLIGLQMREIVGRFVSGDWTEVALLALATCTAVVLARIAYVMSYDAVYRWQVRRTGPPTAHGRLLLQPTRGAAMLIAWAGMRGIVTLAAALALPGGFPQRDAIVFASVCVVLVTLGLQGLTLAPLLRRLGLADDGSVEGELALARRRAAEAAVQLLEAVPPSAARDALLRDYGARAADGDELPPEAHDLAALQRRAVAAQRDALEMLRRAGTIGDNAYHAVEEELDLLELGAHPRLRTA